MVNNKEMNIYIRNLAYSFSIFGDFRVFNGIEAQYDKKQMSFREDDFECRFVAESIPELADAHPGDLYKLEVKEEEDPQYGHQWRAVSAERVETVLLRVIRQFLAQIGGKYLTPKRRETLLKAHGEKVLDAILTDPLALDVIEASPDSKRSICLAINKNRSFADLLAFLANRAWDCRWATQLYEWYHDDAILMLRRDPYLLYKRELAGFKTADRAFLDVYNTVNAPLRCQNAVMAALCEEAKQAGGTFIPRDELRGKIAPLLGDSGPYASASNCTISEDDISKAMDWLEECRTIYVDHVNGKEAVYLSSLYRAEACVAEGIKAFCQAKKRVTCPSDKLDSFLAEYKTAGGQQLTSAQCAAVRQMLTAPVCIVTGGPGTGKTSLVEAAIDALLKLCPQATIQCCAPTDKAAGRMPAEACTIDRLIESEKWKHINRISSREPDLVFVDEVSMVDIKLFEKLLVVLPVGARLVLIGDQNQLPSIEAGQLLRDLIDSDVIRTVQLREVFRQNKDSAIRSNSEKVLQTEADQDIYLDEKGADFAFNKHLDNPYRIPGAVIQAIELVQKTGTPLNEIQVITRQQRGEFGARNLNHLQQAHFNDQPEENRLYYGSKEFRLHDRVIHIKNNYDLNVFNGEIGEVVEIHCTREWALTVQYPSKTVRYSEKDLEELDLAYALTAHKCQGSEFETVIIPIAGKGITRRWLYTAETRGKKLVLLIGTEDALTADMRGETTDERASHLALRLRRLLPPILPETEQLSMFPSTAP